MLGWLLILLCLCGTNAELISSGSKTGTIPEMAQLQFDSGVADLKATSFKIYWGLLGQSSDSSWLLQPSNVLEVYLPGFAGGSNFFGAYRGSTATTESQINFVTTEYGKVMISQSLSEPWQQAVSSTLSRDVSGPGVLGCMGIVGDVSSNTFDLKQLNASTFEYCEWNAQRETLRLKLERDVSVKSVTGVFINKASMYQNYDTSGEMNGLGPLPPLGGIDDNWHQMAYVSIYQYATSSTDCTGVDLSSFSGTTCSQSSLVYQVPFDKYKSQRFGTDKPRLPVRKEAGGVGLAKKPTFVYAAAAGNTDGQSQSSCITITFVPSMTIYSDATTSSTFTISGLTGSQTSQSTIKIYQNKCQCEQSGASLFPTRFESTTNGNHASYADFDQTNGIVKFQLIPGNYIQAGEVITMSIPLKTPSQLSSSKTLSLAMTGWTCQKNDFCVGANAQSVSVPAVQFSPSSKVLESAGDKLKISVYQSSHDPSSFSNMFVTLSPNFDITSQSVITVSGLCGTQETGSSVTILSNAFAGGNPLTDKCSPYGSPQEVDIGALTKNGGTTPYTFDWSITSGQLKITVQQALKARGHYAFAWNWKLTNKANSACSLTASFSSGQNVISSEAVANVGNTVGLVNAPGFIKYKIGQATTRPDVPNYICVTLKSNIDVGSFTSNAQYNQATLTISGLSGSQAVSNSNPSIYSCPSFDWSNYSLTAPSVPSTSYFTSAINAGTPNTVSNFQSGIATLIMNPGVTLKANHEITFAIQLKNPKQAQNCQSVTLSLSATSGTGADQYQFTQSVPMVVSPVNRALQDGEQDGDSCPLKVYDKGFLTKLVAQSNPMIQEPANLITLTLRSNVDLGTATQSVVTISGLTGSNTGSTTSFLTSITSASSLPTEYSPSITKAIWTQSSGQLELFLGSSPCALPKRGTATNCILAGWTYVIQFSLKNGQTAQSPPLVTLAASYASNLVTSSQSATQPLSSYKAAMFLTSNIFNKYEIGQLYPAPGAINPVCVTLRPNKDMTNLATFTISGLTQFAQISPVELYDEWGINKISSTSYANYFQTVKSTQANYADFQNSNGELQFQFVGSSTSSTGATMAAGTKYKFCFRMQNANTGSGVTSSSCPTITMKVDDKQDFPNIAPGTQTYTLVQDTSKRIYGYSDFQSSCAGNIADPSFPLSTIRSSSNVTSNNVWMTLELQPNFGLSSQAITVSPLDNYQAIGSASSFPCWVSRNGIFVNAASSANAGNRHSQDFASTCKYENGNEFKVSFLPSYNLPVYNPYENVHALRSSGIYQILVTSSGSGYTKVPDVVICGSNFTLQSACTNVMYGVGQGATATATLVGGKVSSIQVTNPGHGYYIPPTIVLVAQAGDVVTQATAQAYLYDKGIYTVQFQIQNPLNEQSASALSIQSTPNFPVKQMTSDATSNGLGMTLGYGVSDVVLNIIPQTRLLAGDSLFVNLPAYEVEESGPIFGVSSNSKAFITFTSQLEWELFGDSEDRARAYLNKGYIADGNRHRSGDADVDGVFVLSPSDDGYKKNKDLCWSYKQCPWQLSDYTFGPTSFAPTKVVAGPSPLGYTNEACYQPPSSISASGSQYIGMQVSCTNNAFVTPSASSGSSVSSIRVRNGGLFTTTTSGLAHTVTVAASDAGPSQSATAEVTYRVTEVTASTLSMNCRVTFSVANPSDQIVAATAHVVPFISKYTGSTVSAPSYRIQIDNPGVYKTVPIATCSDGTSVTTTVSIASVNIISQGSGYLSIPTFTVTPPSGLTQNAAPEFEVSLSSAQKQVITKTIVDWNSAGSCFVVGEEFPTNFLTDCAMHVKENVGRYTGMYAMIGSNEYLIKQGGGGVYWIEDSKGNKPRNVDIANKPYTIYSQLELKVAKSARVEPGQPISITIPGYRFKSIPSNMQAFITPSTDDASKTIAERTRYYFTTSVPSKGMYTKGYGVSGMVILTGNLAGNCKLSYIDRPQNTDGSAPEVQYIYGTTPKFAITHVGSGYLYPPRFEGNCSQYTSPTSSPIITYFSGIFMLNGRNGVSRVEVTVQGSRCSSSTQVSIDSPNPKDTYIDGLTGQTYAGESAKVTFSLVGNSISEVILTQSGSGYITPPLVTISGCDAEAKAHLEQNYSSTVAMQYETSHNQFLYDWERDEVSTLNGLAAAEFGSVSMFSMESAATSNAEADSTYQPSRNVDINVEGTLALSSFKNYRGSYQATTTATSALKSYANPVSPSMDSVVIAGFNQACGSSSGETVKFAWDSTTSTYKNSRVTGVTVSQAGTGYTFSGTTVSFSASPVASQNQYANAKGVPTWTIGTGTIPVSIESTAILYKGGALNTTLCSGLVLYFSKPERTGGKALQVTIDSSGAVTISQQGTGYASTPYVYDLMQMSSSKYYLKDQFTSSGNCVPQYFSINPALLNLGTGQSLVIDGVYMTQEGYGYLPSAPPTVTFNCPSCTITVAATATAVLDSAFPSAGTPTQKSFANAFFSPINRNDLEVCEATNPSSGDYRSRKTLQMRVSSGVSPVQATSGATTFSAKRSQGFLGVKGSLTFSLASAGSLSTMCTPPAVVIDPPQSSSGIQAEVKLTIISVRDEAYLSTSPGTSIPAAAPTYTYGIKVLNAGSGYTTSPQITMVWVDSNTCSSWPTLTANVNSKLSVSNVVVETAPTYLCQGPYYITWNETNLMASSARVNPGDAEIVWDRRVNMPRIVSEGYGFPSTVANQIISLTPTSSCDASVWVYFQDYVLEAQAPFPAFWPGDISVDQSVWRNHAGEVTGIDLLYESRHFFSNPAVTTTSNSSALTNAVTAAATTIYVSAALQANNNILIDTEVMLVSSCGTTSPISCTVERAQQGTTAAAHAASAEIVSPIDANYFFSTTVGATGVTESIAGSNAGFYARAVVTNPGTKDTTPMVYIDAISVINHNPIKLANAPVITLNYLNSASSLTATAGANSSQLVIPSIDYPVMYEPATYSADPLYYQDRMDGFNWMTSTATFNQGANIMNASSSSYSSPMYLLDSFGQMLGDHMTKSQKLVISSYSLQSASTTVTSLITQPAGSAMQTSVSVEQQSSIIGSVWGRRAQVYSPHLGRPITSVTPSGTEKPNSITKNISSTDTGFTVALAPFIPNDYIRVDDEVMMVKTVTGNEITVVRGQRNTYASAHTSGTALYSDCIGRLYAQPEYEGGEPAVLNFDGTTVSVLNGGSGYNSKVKIYGCGSASRCDGSTALQNTCSLSFSATLGSPVNELYFNNTIAARSLAGQINGISSSSSRFMIWKTVSRKVSPVVVSSAPSPPGAGSSTTTPSGGTNVGAIVGGVIGGVAGAALLGFLAYKFLAPAAVAKAPVEEMVPVYLPQTYPVLPVEYGSAAPMPGSVPVVSPQPQVMPVNASPMYGHQPFAYGM
eukprot:766629-Hanusia_phi.AAC.4